MAVKLNYTIQSSNFETVRDKIALILKTEMDNQALRRGTPNPNPQPNTPNPDYTANFYIERFEPVGKEEGNVITVDIDSGQLDNSTPITQSFKCSFNIDIWTTAKQTSGNHGYYNSAVKLQRLAGLVRHILMSPYYDKLDLVKGIIERRDVTRIQFAKVNDEQDASFTRMCRITFEVSMVESSEQITPITATGYDTIIKIEETDKGFLLTYNNE